MAIGPFKETIADVFSQRYGVGGFSIVKQAMKVSTSGDLQGENMMKALFDVNNIRKPGTFQAGTGKSRPSPMD
jgi:hypothetical protein